MNLKQQSYRSSLPESRCQRRQYCAGLTNGLTEEKQLYVFHAQDRSVKLACFPLKLFLLQFQI